MPPLIAVRSFGGQQPAIDDRLLPDGAASFAQNTWLYDGRVSGMHTLTKIHTLANPNARFVYRIPNSQNVRNMPDALFMEFDSPNASVVKGSVNVATPRYYWCDTVNPPRYSTEDRIQSGQPDLLLGIPAPSNEPTITSGGGVSGVTEVRSYVYTYVSEFGEEGPPSDPSTPHTGKVDDTWQVSLPDIGADGADRLIVARRIYRTITSDQGVADFYFVAEVTSTAAMVYDDTETSDIIVDRGLLTTVDFDPPPTNLYGFVTMPNGMIIGWLRNQLWFCEPFLPHAWPAAYQRSTESDIVGIGVYGQTAVVLTNGVPYICTGNHPRNMTLAKIDGITEPCSSKGSIAATDRGVHYAGPTGIYLVGPGGGGNATAQLLTKDRWQELVNIESLRAAMLGKAYVAYSAPIEGAFQEDAFQDNAFQMVDESGSLAGAWIEMENERIGYITLNNEHPVYNVLRDPWTNEVMLIANGNVYHLDIVEPHTHQTFIWRSKIWDMERLINLGAGKLTYQLANEATAAGTLRIYGDGVLVYSRGLPGNAEVFRLPAGKRYNSYQFEIEANVKLSKMEFATTPKELVSA